MVDGLPEPLRWANPTEVLVRGRRLAYFGGCDYFRLAWRPAVRKAAAQALARGPVNIAASRRTTGNLTDHIGLEHRLARFLDVADAVVTASGSLPAFHAAEALADRVTHVLLDDRAHACLARAAASAGTTVIPFPSGDVAGARKRAMRAGKGARLAVFTDGFFALEGRLAPVQELQAALPAGTWFLVDDAHGFGVLGPRGRGCLEGLALRRDRVLHLGTLSKAAGTFGGFVAGPAELVGSIRTAGRLFAGSTPLPPPLAAAAGAALEWLAGKAADRARATLLRRTAALQQPLVDAGRLPRTSPGATFTLTPSDAAETRRLERRLLDHGILPPRIDYPGGPPGGCFRFALSSAHSPDQWRRLATALQPG